QIIANGNVVVDEKTCAQDHEKQGTECVNVVNEWVTYTGNFAPGILQLEVLVADTKGQVSSKRFWVNVPYTPPPAPGVPAPPKFAEVLKFREEHGLDIDLDPMVDELEINDRVWESMSAWHDPHSPLGEVARASYDRWGVPLRAVDVAELEWRIA